MNPAFRIKKSTLLHLRIPFSFYLLPVFLFALGNQRPSSWTSVILSFFILHFLLYPATNGYNSYFDKDEKSIGGLKNPPAVEKQLYSVSLLLDAVSIILGLLISPMFSVMLLVFGLASKAYSHPSIRLKKYAVTGWIITGFFQGFFSYLMIAEAITKKGLLVFSDINNLIPAFLCTALLWGSYPMTQVYQHEEDQKRGDITLSIRLGIRGTFIFSALVFLFSNALFILYFMEWQSLLTAMLFEIFLAPMLLYFLSWMKMSFRDPSLADHFHTMRLNLISSLCLNAFFTLCLVL